MIMFPVLFQPQITANSVITGLLCQPSSGPLTVCWPGAVFSQLRYAWAFGLSSGTNSLRKSTGHYSCQWRLASSWRGHCEATAPHLITVLTPLLFHIPFLLGASLIAVLPKQVIMTIFNLHCRSSDTWTTSHCFDFIPFHSFTWVERIFPHTEFFVQCPLCLTTSLVVEIAAWCVSLLEH